VLVREVFRGIIVILGEGELSFCEEAKGSPWTS